LATRRPFHSSIKAASAEANARDAAQRQAAQGWKDDVAPMSNASAPTHTMRHEMSVVTPLRPDTKLAEEITDALFTLTQSPNLCIASDRSERAARIAEAKKALHRSNIAFNFGKYNEAIKFGEEYVARLKRVKQIGKAAD
jgi:hypothetical protein